MSRVLRPAMMAATASAALLLSACGGGQSETAAPPPPEVTVVQAGQGVLQLTDTLPGRVAAFRIAEIRPQVGGIIQRRLFTEGAMVRAGQPLYQINAAPFRADAASAAAALRRAEAVANQARVQRDRLKTLVETDAISRQQFDNAEAAVQQAEADVGVARATLARRNLDVGFATVTAPISGRIGASAVTEGALVSAAGGEAMATVNQINQVYIDVSQPASRMEALRQLGQGSPEVELLDDAGQPLGVTGRLLFSDVAVDPATGDMRARVLVDNASGRLFPGMFVRVRMPRGPEQTALRVPQQAVTHTGAQAQVMVVGADGKVQARPIKVGAVVNNQYIVESGLRPGETVIVEGQDRAQPGVAVKTKPWRPQPAAPSASSAS